MINIKTRVLKFLVNLKRELIWTQHNRIYYKLRRKNMDLQPVDSNNVRICFVLQRSEIFTSVQTIFEMCCNNDDFDVSILVLPRYDHGACQLDISSINRNVQFCQSIEGFFRIINPYNKRTGHFKELEKNQFDYIFLGLPYQKQYPTEYTFKKLSESGRLCYTPYGSYYADGKEMIRLGFPNELLKYLDYVFADVNKVYEFVNGKLCLCRNRDNKSITYCVGYPRFDLIERKIVTDKINTFLWLPRWTANNNDNEKSTFMDYKDQMLDFFMTNKHLSLIIRPHPAMFENFIANGVMSASEVEEYKKMINQIDNVVLDDAPAYALSFAKADCLIADYTSLVIEFLLSNKPVIYLGRTSTIENEIKAAFYCCESFESINEKINSLQDGNDNAHESRLKVLADEKYQKGAAARILDVLTK